MRKHLLSAILFIFAGAPIPGCGAATSTDPGYSGRTEASSDAPAPGSYGPARSEPEQTQDRKKDDDKRGNTPVGKDRTGAGPADGAILDPQGTVSKPVIRERQ